ncbi:MAG: GSCFA domain-containing protein [Rikenellaceae bacterium]
MKFRTEIEIPQSEVQLDYSSRILSLGSCFATSIGGKLRDAKFTTCINPIGVLFNPLSICSALQRFSERRFVSIDELQHGCDGWFHYDFHSSLSDVDPAVALQKINRAVEQGATALENSDTIVLTFGTSWIYELIASGVAVANCHKEPARSFSRRSMDIEEIVRVVGELVAKYSNKRFIISVSPIRHIKDGLVENSLSKATLRVAIAQIVEKFANAHYFPAYEILLDDLRDYRFYADDMLHPSSQAIEYIWSKFCHTHISAATKLKMNNILDIVRAAAHRPFNEASSAYQTFCRKQLELIEKFQDVDLSEESAYFVRQLQNNL